MCGKGLRKGMRWCGPSLASQRPSLELTSKAAPSFQKKKIPKFHSCLVPAAMLPIPWLSINPVFGAVARPPPLAHLVEVASWPAMSR